jgi:flavin-dependent dehydrogenase
MSDSQTYDVIIIGGGLAGLSLAIQLARKQHTVLVLEKESYPKHKVCGEYISMESKPFLQSLGVALDDMELPVVNQLQVTDTRGNEVNETLPMGGFGISRYMLDANLAQLAGDAGATLLTKTRADDVQFADDLFTVHTRDCVFTSKLVCGTWGKRSNVDVKMKRPFIAGKNHALNNYVGIKYHIRYSHPANRIALHNFSDGYCGVSRIEDEKVCFCYLTTAANLQKSNNDIKKMEAAILMKNPWLDRIFRSAEFLYDAPLAISQISFQKKEQVLDHVLLLGDASGMITPLCGNGMSMALRAAKIAAPLIDTFLTQRISRSEMETGYTANWKSIFSKRVAMGRFVQSNFGKDQTTSLFLRAANFLPPLRRVLIRSTSGEPF